MNMKTIIVEPTPPATAAAGTSQSTTAAGTGNATHIPASPVPAHHSHDSSSGDVVHVFTISLRSGTHVAEIRIRPPASYDVGKPAHVTLTLLNDFLNFHETGKAGRTLTGVVHSYMQPLLSLAVHSSKNPNAPRTVLQIHKPSDEVRVWSPYSVPTTNPLHPPPHTATNNKSSTAPAAAATPSPLPHAAQFLSAAAPPHTLNTGTRIGSTTNNTTGTHTGAAAADHKHAPTPAAPAPAVAAASSTHTHTPLPVPIPESQKYVLDFDYPLTLFLSFAMLVALEYYRSHDSIPF